MSVEISEFYLVLGIIVCFAAALLIINKVKKPKEE